MGELKDKYGREKQKKEQGERVKQFQKMDEKTKLNKHHYKFRGCISECFEPYMK